MIYKIKQQLGKIIKNFVTKNFSVYSNIDSNSLSNQDLKISSEKIVRKIAKLIMVTENNNNKFYEMAENDNGTFTVQYGRVGSKKTEVNYLMSEWEKKYREKIQKGYTDQTHLFAEKTITIQSIC